MTEDILQIAQAKAGILVEALPYMQRYHGQIVVVKYGGNAMISDELKAAVIQDLILMQLVGMRPVVVHGGGPDIGELLGKLGIATSFINGLRVTDAATIEAVKMALMGKVNPGIVAQINQQGGKAIGFSGIDAEMLLCEPVTDKPELGFVGQIAEVNVQMLLTNMAAGYIPVISPLGCDKEGNFYNINADYAAGRIAAALKAKRLMLLTDVPGIYVNPDRKQDILTSLRVDEVPYLVAQGILVGGMIPKVECCIDALAAGVDGTSILDGRQPHCLLLEMFTNEGMGTMIVK